MRTSQTKKTNLIKTSATFLVVFLLSFVVSVIAKLFPNSFAVECTDDITSSGGVCGIDTTDVHVSVEGGWAISVSSSGMLNLDLTPTSSGSFSTITDNLNIYTNIPTGYQLYLNSTSGSTDIYNNNLLDDNGNLSIDLPTGTNTNHFSATNGTKATPVELAGDTWGYSLGTTPTTFAKVALTSEDADSNIYSNSNKTSSSGDDILVTYGFKADTKLSPGTYSTGVTYTAIADAPTYTIASVSPNELKLDDQTDKTITIMTSTPTSELAFGNISAKIGAVDLTNCTEITSDGYRGAECTYNGNLDYGTYNVELTSSWHNATYILTDGFNIKNNAFNGITTMQEMTSAICKAAPAKEKAELLDARGQGNGGSDKTSTYGIVKALGNTGDEGSECWMTDNLNLYNVTISASDSDFTSPSSYTIPAGITATSQWDSSAYYAKRVEIAHGLGKNANTKEGDGIWGIVYYSWTSAVAKETTSGVTTAPGTSICPKNWQLPPSGNTSTAKSYAHLLQNVATNPITTGAQLLDNADLGFTRYYGLWDYRVPSEDLQDSVGFFWSGTPSKAGSAYDLRYVSSTMAQYSHPMGQGFSVRCVSR